MPTPMLEVRYLFEHSLGGDRGPRLLRYLLDRGADELSITVMALQDVQAPFADAFEDELGPHERPAAERRVLTASAKGDVVRPVRLWTFDATTLDRLLSFAHEGLFRWPAGPDGWLEDLTIYRKGELVLGLVSHEMEGVLRLTHEEHLEVAALGVPSEATAQWIAY